MDFLKNQQFTFALLDAARLLREAFEHAHRDMKISWPQIRIMSRLYGQEGIAQSEMGLQLEMDAMTISRQIDKLVELGFVERRMERGDRRLRRLYLTPHSRTVRSEIETRTLGVLHQALQSLDCQQQEALVSMLRQVSDDLCGPGAFGAPNASRARSQTFMQ